eukprot:PhF_6_TR39675/c0_g1_i2/m.58920
MAHGFREPRRGGVLPLDSHHTEGRCRRKCCIGDSTGHHHAPGCCELPSGSKHRGSLQCVAVCHGRPCGSEHLVGGVANMHEEYHPLCCHPTRCFFVFIHSIRHAVRIIEFIRRAHD